MDETRRAALARLVFYPKDIARVFDLQSVLHLCFFLTFVLQLGCP